MSCEQVAVLDLGCSNIFSVCTALEKAGARPVVVATPAEVKVAKRLILPGVGRFAAGVTAIDAMGIRQDLIERIKENRPTAAFCLGMQLLFEASEESPGAAGLGVVPGVVVPVYVDGSANFGWDRLGRADNAPYVYFTHSYCVRSVPDLWSPVIAGGDRAGDFVASISRGNVLGCQFHPEISGFGGQQILKDWLRRPGDGQWP